MSEQDARLFSCPFCGGPAQFDAACEDWVPFCDADGCWACLGAYGEEDEAIAAWNRRTATQAAKSGGDAAMRAPRLVEIEAPYPFVRQEGEARSIPEDADDEAWPFADSWRPGVREEYEYDRSGEEVTDVHRAADGTGAILLTEFTAFRNAQGREMVTYKRRWRDPDGRVFGKGDYRVCSREKFDRMAKGYAFDFEVTD